MKFIVFLLVFLFGGCHSAQTFDCVKGADDIDTALAAAVEIWPTVSDVVDNVEIMCVPGAKVRKLARCGSYTKDTESCLMWRGSVVAPARIYIDDREDAALAVCHEMGHAVPQVWNTPDGCQIHNESCNWDEVGVQKCIEAVLNGRESSRVPFATTLFFLMIITPIIIGPPF